MTVAFLIGLILLFLCLAIVITSAEAALSFFPRQDVRSILRGDNLGKGSSWGYLQKIFQEPIRHFNALAFWRVWCEMAAAVAIALLFSVFIDQVWLAGLLATVLMAALVFVLVGVSPRQYGRRHALAAARATAWLVRLLCVVLGPIPEWLIRMGSLVAPGSKSSSFISAEEFRDFVERANAEDTIEESEAELIQSVFELDETLVRSVMVPRTNIIGVERDISLDEAISQFIHSGYSRMPIFGSSSDEVLGVLYLKDAVAAQHQQTQHGATTATVEQLARPVRYVPESKIVGDLLRELQGESTHVAIVVDEYGGTAGLVTLEDLLEEIVGEIVDEYDSEMPEVVELEAGKYRVAATMSLDDFGELFDSELTDEEVDTVGGLLAKHLGRVPRLGDSVEIEFSPQSRVGLYVERMEDHHRRVSYLLAEKRQESLAAEASEQLSSSDKAVELKGSQEKERS